MHTGKFWDGKIDNAVVTVHFTQKVSPDQIDRKTTPADFTITDSSIIWEFKNFEPTEEHNVHLQITSFKTFRKMDKYRLALSNPEVDTRTKLAIMEMWNIKNVGNLQSFQTVYSGRLLIICGVDKKRCSKIQGIFKEKCCNPEVN